MMNSDTRHDRDPFTFSIDGIRTVNSHAMAPAIANNGINRTWDARLRRAAAPAPRGDRAGATDQIEIVLARYFAHGCCNAA